MTHSVQRITRMFFILILCTTLPLGALAQFYDDFEIDGNADDSNLPEDPPDDWENIWMPPNSALASVFIDQSTEGYDVDTTGFTGGGSKDTEDIPNWIIDSTPAIQAKNEIQNAYAAAYICPAARTDCVEGDLIVYLGADRHAFNGAAQLGFWLLRGDLMIDGTGFVRPSDPGVPATHSEGDWLLQVDYAQGGATFVFRVYRWLGGALSLITERTNPICNAPPVAPLTADTLQQACAIVNTANLDLPWPHDKKQNGPVEECNTPPCTIPAGGFFEGRLNLSQLAGTQTQLPCTATFLAETRSSPSDDSTLSDLALAKFTICDIEIDKTSNIAQACTIDDVAPTITYKYMVTNNSQVPVDVYVIDDNGTPGNTADDFDVIDGAISGPAATGSTMDGWDTVTIPAGESRMWEYNLAISSTTTNVATARAFSGDELAFVEDTDDHTVTILDCSIEVTKEVDKPDMCLQDGDVTYSYSVTNTGDITLTGVELVDDAGTPGAPGDDETIIDSLTLTPGETVSGLTWNVDLDMADGDIVMNTVTATGSVSGGTVSATASADVEAYDCSIDVTKTPQAAAVCSTDDVAYDYKITNDGSIAVTMVAATDDNGTADDADNVDLSLSATDLNPGAMATATYSRALTETDDDPLTNIVVAVAKAFAGLDAEFEVMADASAEVDIQACTITVNKVCDPTDDDGKFNLLIDGSGSTDTACGGSYGPIDVLPGDYTVSETAGTDTDLGDYETPAISGDCDASTGVVTVGVGDERVCTITNTRLPTVTFTKVVATGDALPDDFNLTQGGNPVLSGETVTWAVGDTVALDETQVSGYAFVSLTGDKCPNAAGGSTDALAAGDNVTCTITNTLRPTVTVVKEVLVGDAAPDDFNLTQGGVGVTSGQTVVHDINDEVAIDETQLPAYEFVEIVGDGCPTELGGSTDALQAGDMLTCTIRNTLRPKVTLTKVVEVGGASPDAFGLTQNTSDVTSGQTVTYNVDDQVTLDEVGLTGYEFVSAGGDGCPTELGGQTKVLEAGDDLQCEIRNTLQPRVRVIKQIQGGGPAGVNDFGLTQNGNGVSSGQWVTYPVNSTVSINEAGAAGYQFISISGDKCPGSLGGSTDALAAGDEVTCTITNALKPKVTLTKVLEEGDASLDAFGLTQNGNGVSSGQAVEYMVGQTVTLNEAGLTGYELVSVGGDAGCPTELNAATAALQAGDHLMCTITNTKSPTVRVVKVVQGGGPTDENGFGLTQDGVGVSSGEVKTYNVGDTVTINEAVADGYQFISIEGAKCPNALNGDTDALAGGDEITCTITNAYKPRVKLSKIVATGDASEDDFGLTQNAAGVNSGDIVTYMVGDQVTLDEAGLTGYEWVSSGGTAGCPTTLGGQTPVLGAGDFLECTITNTKQPRVRVIKQIQGGGPAGVNDFGLSQNGNSVDSGEWVTYPVDSTVTINEAGASGYQFISISGDKCPGSLGGSTDTLVAGDEVTCTITNALKPKVTLTKIVDVGGASPDAFGLTQNGNGVSSGQAVEYMVGQTVTLNEAGFTGYELVSVGGDAGCPTELNAATAALQAGDHLMCTITNTKSPTVTVIKQIQGGGPASPNDFQLTQDGNGVSSGEVVVHSVGDTVAIGETQVSGYQFIDISGAKCPASVGGSTQALAAGDEVVCTITNARKPKVTLTKVVAVGAASPDDFNLTQNDVGVSSGVAVEYMVGDTVSINETQLDDYVLVSVGGDAKCPNALGGSTQALVAGDDITCTITNTEKGYVDLLKLVNGGITGNTFLFRLTGPSVDISANVGGASVSTFSDVALTPGVTYTLCESDLAVAATAVWWEDVDGGGTIDGGDTSLVAYNPDHPQDLGNRCYDFSVQSGATFHFIVNNTVPEGDARTPGYWSNWSSCSNGNQFDKATDEFWNNVEPRHITLDEALNYGMTIGNLVLAADSNNNPYDGSNTSDCQKARYILQGRDIMGKKQSGDAAYILARSYLAYLANQYANAGFCPEADAAASSAQLLLMGINFTGKGRYLSNKGKNKADPTTRNDALTYHGILDAYNNNTLACTPP